MAEKTQLECDVLRHTLTQIARSRHKTELLCSIGHSQKGGSALSRLERAIVDGGDIAGKYLEIHGERPA